MAERVLPPSTEDRVRLSTWATVTIALLLGLSFRLALGTLPIVDRGRIFVDAAAATAVLAVLALRSIPLRWLVRVYALIGAVLLLRLGTLRTGSGIVAARDVVLWAIVTAAAMALCPTPERTTRTLGRGRSGAPAADAGSEPAPGLPTGASAGAATSVGATSVVASADAGRSGVSMSTVARGAVAASLVVAAVTLLVGPLAGDRSPVAPSGGDAPNPFDSGRDNALTVQERLDMTTRPRLTDAVVMTVRSDVVSFWRNATYDRWDGRTWTSTDGGSYRVIPPTGAVYPSPEDLAARDGDASTQQFRLEASFANALPVAPSAVRVTGADGRLIQRLDGSVVAPEALGKGATYTVESRQPHVTEAELRSIDGPVPDAVAVRYGRPARTTDRVRVLAERIVADAGVADGPAVAKVHALEDWMGEHLTYSLDAPLAPEGVDVVDHFLFESKQGWCEQIASSLVVMLRQVGVPTRLATGYAPGEWDGSGGRFVVRERDAHAWAEVWFPDVGWVSFDPTAEVPLAGDAASSTSELPIGLAGIAVVLLFVGAVAVLAAPLARRLHGWRERRAAGRAADRLAAERWDVRVERELEDLGRDVGRPRAPSETVSGHARELAAVTGRSELADQGAAVDDHRYTPPPP